MISRRDMIKHIGIGLCAGAAVPFLPSLLPKLKQIPIDYFRFPGENDSQLRKIILGHPIGIEIGESYDSSFKNLSFIPRL